MVVLDNYWAVWIAEEGDNSVSPKWISRTVNSGSTKLFGGWQSEGLQRYGEYCREVIHEKQTRESRDAEEQFKVHVYDEYMTDSQKRLYSRLESQNELLVCYGAAREDEVFNLLDE